MFLALNDAMSAWEKEKDNLPSELFLGVTKCRHFCDQKRKNKRKTSRAFLHVVFSGVVEVEVFFFFPRSVGQEKRRRKKKSKREKKKLQPSRHEAGPGHFAASLATTKAGTFFFFFFYSAGLRFNAK